MSDSMQLFMELGMYVYVHYTVTGSGRLAVV